MCSLQQYSSILIVTFCRENNLRDKLNLFEKQSRDLQQHKIVLSRKETRLSSEYASIPILKNISNSNILLCHREKEIKNREESLQHRKADHESRCACVCEKETDKLYTNIFGTIGSPNVHYSKQTFEEFMRLETTAHNEKTYV